MYFIHIKINKEYFYNGGIDLKKLYIVIIGLVICAIGIVIFFKFKNNSLDETLKEAKSMSSYQLVCDMEMTQNDELKSYEVKVDYLKKDKQKYYRVELYDKSLNQSQIIIKNKKSGQKLTAFFCANFRVYSPKCFFTVSRTCSSLISATGTASTRRSFSACKTQANVSISFSYLLKNRQPTAVDINDLAIDVA